MRFFWTSLFLFLITTQIASAQILITEIMYDLEGSDSGREWVEITNTGSDSVDLTGWKFFENDTNHGLTIYQGDINLSAKESAIIVDNPSKFLSDWPSFSGIIFDSSFSLKNTGELISIRNDELTDIDEINYIPDWGGSGDGNSLQVENGTWSGFSPTPGIHSFVSSNGSGQSNSSTNSGGNGTPYSQFPTGKIKTRIEAETIVLSGADSFYEAEGLGLEDEPLEDARYIWNFGDGSIREGEKVLHSYIYPGEYVIYLDVSSGSFSTSDKVYVKVIPSPIFISEANNNFIKIKNTSNEELNVSFWFLGIEEKSFQIPDNTYIRKNGEIIFPKEITGLEANIDSINLLYPNGAVANKPENKKPETIKKIQTPQIPQTHSVSNSNNLKNITKKEVVIESKEQVASPILSNSNIETFENENEGLISKWTIALLGLIAVSLSGFFLLKKDNKVEGFTIIE